ncbi:MAG: preprotein translocase subunit SecG [Candidatus Liptonbacteria bacterium RIFCSPLOWO2_01_FULL_45_15]|uniref:Protein-export membrane protein SecG n=1 Tax=Candidatus Liptonbacteria bacterium RIFCSPLOWO2_01_FULL_45_15 TaxID=1798649 RepID=A0A1G2CD73_9BACT|nr:MAG: preprotein translocase subunit SecG [Candidatus Liptonbacteria bacterium RIFCSPLOWO2_01_FULL_45_15]
MKIITVIQAIISVLIVILILLQERSAGLSGIFGGEGGGAFYQTRRGMEKTIFSTTIALAIIFLGLAIAQLLV